MRDVSNLDWPTSPFGAEFRPVGRQPTLAVGVSFYGLRGTAAEVGHAVGACAVYLPATRVRRELDPNRFPQFGYRLMAASPASENLDCLSAAVDTVLLQARRHALFVAAANLASDLSTLQRLAPRPLRGVGGLLAAWQQRSVKGRGMATMIDTELDVMDSELDTIPPRIADQSLGTWLIATALSAAVVAGVYRDFYALRQAPDFVAMVDEFAWDHLAEFAAS